MKSGLNKKRIIVAISGLIGSFLLGIFLYLSFFMSILPKYRIAVVSILPAETQVSFFGFILAEKETIFSGSTVKYGAIEMLLYDQEHGDGLNFEAEDLIKFAGDYMQSNYDVNYYMEPLPAWSRQIIANSDDNEAILKTINSFNRENDESGKCYFVSRIPNTSAVKLDALKNVSQKCLERISK